MIAARTFPGTAGGFKCNLENGRGGRRMKVAAKWRLRSD